MSTLPTLATKWGESVDALRVLIRRDPALRALGTKFGATRIFTEQEAKQIRDAMEQRKLAAVK